MVSTKLSVAVAVLVRSVGIRHDGWRQAAGWSVVVGFAACLVVELANQRRGSRRASLS
jgi:hypothetical protein